MVTTGHEEGSRMVDTTCEAHLMIDEVSVESNSMGTSIKCKCNVLGCTDPGQVGKSVSEFFKTDGKAAGMFLNLAEAAGLVTREQRKAAQEQGIGMNIDETQLKGRQLCAKITMKPNLRKNPATGQMEVDSEKPGPYPRIGFDTFSVWDAKAAAIPKDQQFLAMVPRPQQQPPLPPPPPQGAPQQSLPLTGSANPAMSMNW